MSTAIKPAAGAPLAWEGVFNARDLGGHPTPTGLTRRQAVVRSDAPVRMTDAGQRQVVEYGIRGFLDLRSDEESAAEPSPFAAGRGYRRVAVLDRTAMQHIARYSAGEDLLEYMLFERSDLVAEALLNLLDLSADGGVLVHCRAGKDRAGLIAALLLANAGVSRAGVAEDHARSEAAVASLYRLWASQAATEDERRLLSQQRFAPTAAALHAAFSRLDRGHGGVPSYLRAIGLSADEVAALRLVLAPLDARNPSLTYL